MPLALMGLTVFTPPVTQQGLGRLHHRQGNASSYSRIIPIPWLPLALTVTESFPCHQPSPDTDPHPGEPPTGVVTGGSALPTAPYTNCHKPVKPVPVSAEDGDPSPGSLWICVIDCNR